MLPEEFEKRTHIYPTAGLYSVIEETYMQFEGDKDSFCKAYVNNTDGIAEKIQRHAQNNEIQHEREWKLREEDLQKKINALKAECESLRTRLDKELDWKAYQISRMNQLQYENLRKSSGTKVLEISDVAAWIAEEFGFSYSNILVLNSIPLYEINRHRQIRKNGEVQRGPVYNATDWNYVRFNVKEWQYEVVNGYLFQYCD